MTTLRLKPKRGGFLRPFGCGGFARGSLDGNAPYWSTVVNSTVDGSWADILRYHKEALSRYQPYTEPPRKSADKEKHHIDPNNIEQLYQQYLARMPYEANDCRDHSFAVYFSNLQRLDWVEPSGKLEQSVFPSNYPPGQPSEYYRLNVRGKTAFDSAWANPVVTLYTGH